MKPREGKALSPPGAYRSPTSWNTPTNEWPHLPHCTLGCFATGAPSSTGVPSSIAPSSNFWPPLGAAASSAGAAGGCMNLHTWFRLGERPA